MTLNLKKNIFITFTGSILLVFTLFSCKKKDSNDIPNSIKVCEEKLPPFNEKFSGQEDIEKLKKLCKCIWRNLPADGWERKVSEKLYNGEDIGWKIKSFSTIFEAKLNTCKKEILHE